MDFLMNADIQMMQHIETQQTAAAKNSSSDSNEFQKLLERRQKADSTGQPQQETEVKSETVTETEETPATPVTAPIEEDPQLQEQMALAAMAAMQAPVVYVDAEQPAQVTAETAPVETLMTVETAPEQLLPEQQMQGKTVLQQPEQQQTMQEEPQVTVAPQDKNTVEVSGQQQTSGQQTGSELQGENQSEDEYTVVNAGVETSETPVFEETEKVLVKVGDAPVAEKTAGEKPVQAQVGDKLVTVLQSGDDHVELQLQPEHLGRVTIDVTMSKDGTLHIALRAENSVTRAMLEQDAASLQSLLMRNTDKDVQIEVPREQESQQQDFEDGRQGHQERDEQQQRREEQQRSDDFLQQLRLGLISL